MLLKKWIGLFAAATLVAGAAAAGCSSTTVSAPDLSNPGGDGGGGGSDTGTGGNPDAKTGTDAKSDRVVTNPDAPVTGQCSPQAVTNPTQPTPAYKPYLKTAACNNTQISTFFTQCVDTAATQTTCQSFLSDTNNTACNACLITPANQANWGPIVQVGTGDFPFNIAGCFGIVLNEGSSTTGCGAARWEFDRCLKASCPIENCCADPNNCTTAEDTAYSDCRSASYAAGAPCEAAVNDLNTKCAALDTDANAALLNTACPIQGTLQAFTVAITTSFCGGAASDGGGGG
jgi:hypothetical protein